MEVPGYPCITYLKYNTSNCENLQTECDKHDNSFTTLLKSNNVLHIPIPGIYRDGRMYLS